MAVEDYPRNSQNAKSDAPPKLEKAIEGSVRRRKKPLGRRFSETFFTSDSEGVFRYVVADVVIPYIKDLLVDSVNTAMERKFYGSSRPVARRSGGRSSSSSRKHTPYNRYSKSSEPAPRKSISERARTSSNIDEILFDTRREAEDILDRLLKHVERYGSATLLDFFALVGETGEFTDDRFGWLELSERNTGVRRVRDGYIIDLPRPAALD